MKNLYYLVLIVFIAGCATQYHKADIFGTGFYDTQLAENVFEVSFHGGGASEKHRTRDFAMLRASEITLEHGFTYFSVVGEDDQAEHSQYTTGGNTTTTYNPVTDTTETHTTPVVTHSSTELSSTKRIVCFKEKPEGVFVYDARFVAKSIRDNYGIGSETTSSFWPLNL